VAPQVRAGEAWLGARDASWPWLVQLGLLDQGDPRRCVLGQVAHAWGSTYTALADALHRACGGDFCACLNEHGFGREFQAHWVLLLVHRQQEPKPTKA